MAENSRLSWETPFLNQAIDLAWSESWQIGQRIRTEILSEERAAYGQQILENLSKSLTGEFGRGWSDRQLRYCIRSAEVCPGQNILHTLCAKSSWSHIRQLI